jgi:hypothetical protein
MSPSRPLALAALLALAGPSVVLVPAPARGQGASTVPAEPTAVDPRGLREEAKTNWERDMRVIKEGQIDAETNRVTGLRDCKKDKACERQVMETYHDRQRELANQKTARTALYKKVLLEISELERQYKASQRARPAPPRP